MKNNHQLQSNGHVKFELDRSRERTSLTQLHIWKTFATPEMYGVLTAMLGDNYMASPQYQLNTKCRPFFQSGSNDPKSDYYLIEFWSDNEEAVDQWVEALEQNYVHDFVLARASASTEEEQKKLDELAELYAFRREVHAV